MATVKVFISYRRDTDAARATLIRATLNKSIERAFGADGVMGHGQIDVDVYMDVNDRLGVKWPERIQEAISSADIVIAVIGPNWLSATDQHHRRRIDQEDDWVRRELESALQSECLVVPTLFDGAQMPPASALPSSLSSLAERQGLSVRTEYFDLDIQPLLRELLEYGRGRVDAGYRREAADYAHTRWPYPDPPLPVRPAQLSDQDVDLALELMLDGWRRVDSPLPEEPSKRRVELQRKLSFASFPDVLRFMTQVGIFCEAANHHPRWENVYRTLWVNLSTWDIGHRISQLDLTLAAHIDKVFAEYTQEAIAAKS